ncbi:MAG: MBL fold metallo-hydrolase [Deltaproteobacteria bacterium]|nr:MBL fold metallo-hydrolase [Deltaproteobacteria bacterium]
MKKTGARILLAVALLCGAAPAAMAASGPKEADSRTREMNSRLPSTLLADDRQESEFSLRGLIAADPAVDIRSKDGKPVFDTRPYGFLAADSSNPDTVPPALWRHARRNAVQGLFKVTDGIYQVRGYDITNLTFIEGKTGYIAVDPLMSVETARAALELLRRHLPVKPVVAVIYTHSHVDHWGGVQGIVDAADVAAGKVRIIAPAGLAREAVSENLLAGNAMARRSAYMFGGLLPKGPKGQVDAGIGKAASGGTVSFIPPTEEIASPLQEMTIDGVRFVFQQTPGTEAPVEMNFHLPELKALCMAENVSASLHNLLTPRGAQVRDARAWSRFIDEAIDLFAGGTEVLFTTHHWPRWGREVITDYLKKQRDLYRYIHDQTVRLMNRGYTPAECAEMIVLPASLAAEWYTRDFYGTVHFNVKAVYQRYLGWFDGNPANLQPLPPEDAARKYLQYMGGSASVLARAREDLRRGEYRWVVQALNHVIFAEPDNQDARELQADALEQLGYQSESAVWRNFYLSGAMELRSGVRRDAPLQQAGGDVIRTVPLGTFFDLLAVRLNGPKAEGKRIAVNWIFSNPEERYAVTLENGVLNHKRDRLHPDPDATVYLSREVFNAIAAKQATFLGRILAGDIRVEGRTLKFVEMMSCLDELDPWFNIITP